MDVELSSLSMQTRLLSNGALCSAAASMPGMLSAAASLLLGTAQDMMANMPGILQSHVGESI